MTSLHLTVVTPGRKEITAYQVQDTNAVRIVGFEAEAQYRSEDLLALAKLFTGLAALLGD